jgi:hypothetical protein
MARVDLEAATLWCRRPAGQACSTPSDYWSGKFAESPQYCPSLLYCLSSSILPIVKIVHYFPEQCACVLGPLLLGRCLVAAWSLPGFSAKEITTNHQSPHQTSIRPSLQRTDISSTNFQTSSPDLRDNRSWVLHPRDRTSWR